jgi:ComF family protein
VTRLARLFAGALATELKHARWQADLVCPVPLHWSRYLRRGYNQSALLAKLLAKALEAPYGCPLRRTRRTRQQAKLSRAERFANVQGAFVSRPVSGQILLVDDVITSGATGEACRLALKQAGAREVKIIAIARAYR